MIQFGFIAGALIEQNKFSLQTSTIAKARLVPGCKWFSVQHCYWAKQSACATYHERDGNSFVHLGQQLSFFSLIYKYFGSVSDIKNVGNRVTFPGVSL